MPTLSLDLLTWGLRQRVADAQDDTHGSFRADADAHADALAVAIGAAV